MMKGNKKRTSNWNSFTNQKSIRSTLDQLKDNQLTKLLYKNFKKK